MVVLEVVLATLELCRGSLSRKPPERTALVISLASLEKGKHEMAESIFRNKLFPWIFCGRKM
jgi:hypothetical protein